MWIPRANDKRHAMHRLTKEICPSLITYENNKTKGTLWRNSPKLMINSACLCFLAL